VTHPGPELALGTANWGGSYGAPGREARVDEKTAGQLATLFLDAGHSLVDTAPAYGRAEHMVGEILAGRARVVSKVPAEVMTAPDAVSRAVAGLRESLGRTRVDRFAGVLLHDAGSATREDARAREVVDAVRAEGFADRVGVSVYAPEEAYAAVDRLGADLVQVPCNPLDQRFLESGCLSDLVSAGVEVHVRSSFLNGVLLADPATLEGSLAPLGPAVARLGDLARAEGATVLQLAIAFAREATGAHAVIVGAFAADQLREVLAAWARAGAAGTQPPANREPELDWSRLSASQLPAVDPRTWSR
jgi:aryl-alcohol dehydrogenase-like predicted oxidoreductase